MLALKIIGYILLGILALLVLLLIVPVRLRVRYQTELAATLWVLCVPIRLAPQKEQPQKEQPKGEKPKPKQEKKSEKKPKKKKDVLELKRHAKELKQSGVFAAVAWLKEIAALLLKTVDRLLGAITVKRLFARVDIAGEDAAETALSYGKICAAAYPALGIVESKLRVKKQEVTIAPAFCLEETAFRFDVKLSVCVWKAVIAALALLIGYIKMPSVGELKQQRLRKIRSQNKEAV